jgi:hypothetical protein
MTDEQILELWAGNYPVREDIIAFARALESRVLAERKPVAWRYKFPDGLWRYETFKPSVDGAEPLYATRVESVPGEFEPHGELDADGWTPNVFPEKQYFMQCCDCGLVHEMEFAAVKTELTEGGFHSDELPWPENRVRFKVRRAK